MYARFGSPRILAYSTTPAGNYHDAPLAGDLLVNGAYQPIPLTTEPDGVIWGYSEVLGLSICWVEGRLRFWDRAQQRYLPLLEHHEERQGRLEERQARLEAEARADREAARVRELEEELRRRDNP